MNRVKSAFASDRGRFDAGHPAERILDSIHFAVLSIALKSEREISDASTTPRNLDLKGKTAHPLVPPDLLNAFVFLGNLALQTPEIREKPTYPNGCRRHISFSARPVPRETPLYCRTNYRPLPPDGKRHPLWPNQSVSGLSATSRCNEHLPACAFSFAKQTLGIIPGFGNK